MGDRIAYFKHLKLGDYVVGPPALELPFEGSRMFRSGWAEAAVVDERAPGGAYRVIIRVNFHKDHDSTETQRAYLGRKLTFLKNLRDALSFGSGYNTSGHLALIEDDGTDATTLTNNETAGSGVTVELDASIGAAVSDYVLITDGSSAYEITQVDSVTSSTELVMDLANNWSAGDSIYRLEWYLPTAFAEQIPQIKGHEPGTSRASRDLEFVFVSVNDPTHNL